MNIKIILNEPYKGMTSGWPTRYIGLINELYKSNSLYIYAPGNTSLLKDTFPDAYVCSSSNEEHKKINFSAVKYFASIISPSKTDVFLPIFYYYPDFNSLLFREQSTIRYDIIFYFGLSSYVYYHKLHPNVPKICDFCDSLLRHFLANIKNAKTFKTKIINYLDIIYLFRIKRKFIDNEVSIIGTTEKDISYIKKIIQRNNSFAIPNGIYIPEFQSSEKYFLNKWESKSILFCGSLNYQPNILAIRYILQELWSSLKSIYPDIQLNIVGRQPSADLLAFIKQFKDVNVHKDVPNIIEFYQSAKIALIPIFSGGGIKNKVLEALCTATPIVTNKEGAIGIDLESEKHGFIVEDRQHFIDTTSTILNADLETYSMWANNCFQLAQKYSWTEVGKKLNTTITSIVNKQTLS